MDGISLFLVLDDGLLFPIALAASGDRAGTSRSSPGSLCSKRVPRGVPRPRPAVFFVFFELTLVPVYF